jgi:hypothetical protein
LTSEARVRELRERYGFRALPTTVETRDHVDERTAR